MGDAATRYDESSDKIDGTTNSMVERTNTKLNELTNYMNSLVSSASFHVPKIANPAATSLNLQPGTISTIKPDKPESEITALKQRTAEEPPSDFVIAIDDVSFPGAPFFSGVLSQPDIPDAPVFVAQVPADKPDIADPRALPANITDDRPGTFTVGTYNIPSPNSITIPEFTEDIPANTLVPPTQQFNYVEPDFSLTLKDDVTTKISNDVNNGGTGLAASVEDAIFDRTEERDQLVLDDSIQGLVDEWSGRGFSLPTGVLLKGEERFRIEHFNNRLTTNRDIQKLQADLAQNNTQFAVSSGLSLIEQEFRNANDVNNRALQSERALVEFTIALWETKVTDHNLKLERVRLQAAKNASILQGEGLRLEEYKSQLLEMDARSTVDKDKIANYTAQVNSFNSKAGLFREQVNAVSASIAIENLKLDFYKSQTADYTSRVNAENAKFASHSATVDGELGKVKVFDSQVQAYAAEVAAARVTNESQIAKLNENIKSEDMRLRAYIANIDKWKDKVASANSELGFETSMYGKEVDAFVAETQRDAAQAQLNLKTSEMGQRLDIENLKITASTLNSNLQGTLAAANIRLEAQKALAQTFAGLLTALAGSVQSVLAIEGRAKITESVTS